MSWISVCMGTVHVDISFSTHAPNYYSQSAHHTAILLYIGSYIANISSRHCYMHCQLSSQYWLTPLLHAQSVTEPILVHITVTCIVSYRANITATIANIGSLHCDTLVTRTYPAANRVRIGLPNWACLL